MKQLVKKAEGATMECLNCGESLVCRAVEYQGETKLQWQNEPGGAHYKYKSDGNFECRPSDETAPKRVQDTEPTSEETLAKCAEHIPKEILEIEYERALNHAWKLMAHQAGAQKVLDEVGIKHPSRVAFITSVLRDLNGS